MNTNQLIGFSMIAFALLVVFGAVIKSLGWKEGLACIATAIAGTAFIAVGAHLLKG